MLFTSDNRPRLVCIGCMKTPSELEEYQVAAACEEGTTPDDWCWNEEGTLNRRNGHFLCTDCYIDAGMPSSDSGWVAP